MKFRNRKDSFPGCYEERNVLEIILTILSTSTDIY